MTTAEPMLVLKKVMVASQPLPGETREQLIRSRVQKNNTVKIETPAYGWRPLPHSPTRNTHSLDDADHHLGHEDEEEGHKVEGAIGPAGRQKWPSGQMWCGRKAGPAVAPSDLKAL